MRLMILRDLIDYFFDGMPDYIKSYVYQGIGSYFVWRYGIPLGINVLGKLFGRKIKY